MAQLGLTYDLQVRAWTEKGLQHARRWSFVQCVEVFYTVLGIGASVLV